MLIKDYKFEILGAGKVQMVIAGVAQAADRLYGVARLCIIEVDVRYQLHCLWVPRVQRLVIIGDESVYVFIQKDVVYKDFVFVVHTERTTTELEALC